MLDFFKKMFSKNKTTSELALEKYYDSILSRSDLSSDFKTIFSLIIKNPKKWTIDNYRFSYGNSVSFWIGNGREFFKCELIGKRGRDGKENNILLNFNKIELDIIWKEYIRIRAYHISGILFKLS